MNQKIFVLSFCGKLILMVQITGKNQSLRCRVDNISSAFCWKKDCLIHHSHNSIHLRTNSFQSSVTQCPDVNPFLGTCSGLFGHGVVSYSATKMSRTWFRNDLLTHTLFYSQESESTMYHEDSASPPPGFQFFLPIGAEGPLRLPSSMLIGRHSPEPSSDEQLACRWLKVSDRELVLLFWSMIIKSIKSHNRFPSETY